jgi:hypothetical protein
MIVFVIGATGSPGRHVVPRGVRADLNAMRTRTNALLSSS